jgi:hypothetical protein
VKWDPAGIRPLAPRTPNAWRCSKKVLAFFMPGFIISVFLLDMQPEMPL